jgi:hypothetical protein
MKLLTKEIIAKIPPLYSQENVENPEIIVKFFDAWSDCRWYVLEGQQEEDDWRFFGLFTSGADKELGYFMLSQLESQKFRGCPRIERDMHFKCHRLKEVQNGKAI